MQTAWLFWLKAAPTFVSQAYKAPAGCLVKNLPYIVLNSLSAPGEGGGLPGEGRGVGVSLPPGISPE